MPNVKFINPFIEAATEVLCAEAKVVSTRGNLSLHKSAFTSNQITVLFSLIGQVQGAVMYGMSTATGLALVSRIMGQKFVELDNLAQSGLAELGHVITSRAIDRLTKAGFETSISPAALIQGEGVKISMLDFPRIIVPLNSEIGEITVHLVLSETQSGMEDQPWVWFND